MLDSVYVLLLCWMPAPLPAGLPADAVVYLRGSSEVSQYLLYAPTNSSGSGNVSFTMLAPMVGGWVLGWVGGRAGGWVERGVFTAAPLPCTALASGRQPRYLCCPLLQVQEQEVLVSDWHPSSQDGSQHSSSAGRGYLFAVIYTAEQRNGQLVVTELAPNALAGATADATTGGRRSVTGGGSSSGGSSSNSSNQADGPAGSAGAGRGFWALLQGHSRDVELVDLTGQRSELLVCFCRSICVCMHGRQPRASPQHSAVFALRMPRLLQ